jgi:hypothetical protein
MTNDEVRCLRHSVFGVPCSIFFVPSAFVTVTSQSFRLDGHVNPGNLRKRRPFIRRKFPFLAPHL